MTDTPGYRPLYRQVYDIMVRKVAQGVWRPGTSLPSEQNLAREMGVSQGTMRKVLDALTAENLLERRQGKGTFIAENTQERTLFRFFRIARPGGKRMTPERVDESVKVRASRAPERTKLGLDRRYVGCCANRFSSAAQTGGRLTFRCLAHLHGGAARPCFPCKTIQSPTAAVAFLS